MAGISVDNARGWKIVRKLIKLPKKQGSEGNCSNYEISSHFVSQCFTFVSLGIEKKIQDLTERLETTQRELKTLKTQFDGQEAANSTFCVRENDLKYLWMAVNSTAEKTSNLSSKVTWLLIDLLDHYQFWPRRPRRKFELYCRALVSGTEREKTVFGFLS